MKRERMFLAVSVGVMAVLLAIGGLISGGAAPSYADTVPTPIGVQAGSGGTGWQEVTFLRLSPKAADGGSTGYQIVGYDSMDVQYIIDQPSSVNTTTLNIQYSNDNSTWSDGPNIVASNAADADGMVQVALMGRYARMYYNVTNTQTLTITVRAIAKP